MFCRCLLLSSLIVASLAGCTHRLSGPLHTAEAPPWIAERLAGVTQAFEAFEIHHRVLLIGDTGYYLENDPTLDALDQWATAVESSSVLFLGDNIYDEGLTSEDREHGENILSHQLAATRARKIFIPGNHDWGLWPKKMNAEAIVNQQTFVDTWSDGRAEFIPKDGCMGPDTRVLREQGDGQAAVVFIALDPTPWINARLRKECPRPQTQAEFLEQLDAELARHAEDFVILGSHYPMLTGGPHGGLTYGLIGDMIVTPLGWIAGGLGNTYEPTYADWITRTQAVMRRNPPAIYAAGHDHSLQLLESGDVAGLYVVSGAGAVERVSTVTNLPETLFAHAAPGFVVIDVGRSGDHGMAIIRVIESDAPAPVFEMPFE